MIYVDLDNTLLDAVKRLENEKEIARRHGIDDDLFEKAANLTHETHGISNWSYTVFFESCRILKPCLEETMLHEWQKVIERSGIFPDTIAFLNQFPKENLTLVTTGNHEYQRTKIRTDNLEAYFSEILIVPSPKCHHVTPVYPAVYVDDSPREIDAMKLLHPEIFCILVREPAPWEKQKISLHADVYCPDLTMVRSVITWMRPNILTAS